ncbi:MAG: LysR substrate-binding domain-containing protein [Planctomycetota bacterium]
MEHDLNDFFYFAHVVEKGGFAAAGRALDVPKSLLSRHVQQLEDRLGVRLIQRTSRQFVVTDVGQAFYRRARAALDEMEAAEAEVRCHTGSLSGRVRLSCSVGLSQYALGEILTRFLLENPGVEVIQNVTNQQVNLVEAGIDLALRGHVGALPDSNLIQRTVARAPWFLFASPTYLARAGSPSTPEDLGSHFGLKAGWRPELGEWSLLGPKGESETVHFRPKLCSDDMSMLKKATVTGLGIVALPGYVCREEVLAGELVCVLPDWLAADAQISLLKPASRGALPVVQALAEHLCTELPPVTEMDDASRQES